MTAVVGLLLGVALAVAWAVERRLRLPRDCWRCAGVGRLERWHRLTWKPCPRCGGTGLR